MVALARLMEQGVSPAEIQELAKVDVQLEQELIWSALKGLEPTNDLLPRLDLWPGRKEYRGNRNKSYHHGTAHASSHRLRTISSDLRRRVFRPWRDLSEIWPKANAVVEIQIRGSYRSSNRFPQAFHVNQKWFEADSGREIKSIVERWRTIG